MCVCVCVTGRKKEEIIAKENISPAGIIYWLEYHVLRIWSWDFFDLKKHDENKQKQYNHHTKHFADENKTNRSNTTTTQNILLILIHLTFTVSNGRGGGDSSVVRAPDSWLKGRGFESLLERRENFLLQGRLSVLTLISVSVPPPCYHSST